MKKRAAPAPRADDETAPGPGVRWTPDGAEFAVLSRRATRIRLLLFDRADAAEPSAEHDLLPPPPGGARWSRRVPGVRPGSYYLYRAEGPAPHFDPSRWLLDPCAAEVEFHRRWGDTRGIAPADWTRPGPFFPKGVLVRDDFDWGDDRPPRTPMEDSVLYELHVRGYTASPSSGVYHPGTYRGLVEKLPHLRALGVTAIELLPVAEFNELEFYIEDGLRRDRLNFWGYNPLAFRAPNARYAAAPGPGAAVREFKELVRAGHRAGLEVLLDVVFNHTGEGGDRGPVYSMKGLDRTLYYLHDPAGGMLDFTGCGNTVNANDPAVADLIVETLRHWAIEMRVDGFRFDLASALARGPDGRLLEHPELIARITRDPVLGALKLIAEPWDATGYRHVGHFPGRSWGEWNDLYRDDVRRFWNGEPGLLGRLATRLAGSSDVYGDGGRPTRSINHVTSHDGFTLADLVAYSRRHNEANGEENRDGHPLNHSVNHGAEGPTDDPAIRALRRRHQRNLLATLLVSQGVPMLLGGDEFSRTQRGNNNAYAQDSDVSWVDWSLARTEADLLAFVRRLVAFRRAHASLRRRAFFTGRAEAGAPPDIRWLGPDGADPDWHGGRAVAAHIGGDRRCTGRDADEPDLLLIVNGADERARFVLPPLPTGLAWRVEWTSADAEPGFCPDPPPAILVREQSVTALSSGDAPPAIRGR